MEYNYPPYMYLKQVADHCPKAVSTYMTIWDMMDANNKLHVYKQDVKNDFLMSLNKFKNDLLLLVREGLVSIHESPKAITVEIVDWDFFD